MSTRYSWFSCGALCIGAGAWTGRGEASAGARLWSKSVQARKSESQRDEAIS
ncbi:hypothetical protein [Armatimonas sp.]|uniref:hypothetical protein n=1 Tax=Armatimonas sp. TaxID=1872638 RepID=UPI0037512EEE